MIDPNELIALIVGLVGEVCPDQQCVDDAVAIVNAVLDIVLSACPNLDCVPPIDIGPTIDALIGTIAGICPGLSCTEVITNLVDSLIRTACGTEEDCAQKAQTILNGLIDSRCPNGIAACADEEISLVLGAYDSAYNTIYNTVCPNGEFFQDCGYRYITILAGLVGGISRSSALR